MKVVHITSSLGGDQPLSVFEPANIATGKHPVLLEFQGAGQFGNLAFDGNSVSGKLSAGQKLPALYADAIVVCVHQPAKGFLACEYQRLKDARLWVLANYPTADVNRISLCGLSLGGGGVLAATEDIEFMKLIAAIVPCAGTYDFDIRGKLFSSVKASGIPYIIYGSSTDDNPPTNSCFQVIQFLYNGITAAERQQGTLQDTKTGHGGTWAKAYSFTEAGSMWAWLARQSRSDVVVPPVVVEPPVIDPPAQTKKLLSTIKIPGTPAVAATPDRNVNFYQMPDGTFSNEIV